MDKRRIARLALAAALVAVVVIPAAVPARETTGGASIHLVAYSTPREAFAAIIPAFRRTAAGRDVRVTQSYGPSEEQARAVLAGQPADVVMFSLEPDMTKLVAEGLVAAGWKASRADGFVTRSVVVFAVRKGNPKRIHDWEDLVEPGVEVIAPNPSTSGGARWNVMAAYGATRRKGGTHADAVAYLEDLYRHITVQDKSARDALQTFAAGKGDVLLTYENEAILAREKGQPVEIVIPEATISIENPVATLRTSKNPEAARAFLAFLYTPAAQRVFAASGYRPVVPSRSRGSSFPAVQELFTIDSVGGWAKVNDRFFDARTGIVPRIQRTVGR